MLSHMNLISNDIKIEENFEKILQRKCDSHNKYKAFYFCTNLSCVKNSTSFLCELCYNNHPKSHFNHKEIQYLGDLFQIKRLKQMKEECKIDPSFREKINKVLEDLDNIFGKLKETSSKMIDEECKKTKAQVQQKFSIDYEYIMKAFKEHEKVLLDVFTKDH